MVELLGPDRFGQLLSVLGARLRRVADAEGGGTAEAAAVSHLLHQSRGSAASLGLSALADALGRRDRAAAGRLDAQAPADAPPDLSRSWAEALEAVFALAHAVKAGLRPEDAADTPRRRA